MTERDLFEAALELPPEQRVAYLDGACGGDAALRQRLEALLCKHDRAGGFLESPAPCPVATVDEPASERPGTVIGLYKLLQPIGEGGMGAVFMAEQTEPVQRKVALKLIKPGMDSGQVVARFEAERQALALMDHPNIARVFDGGATPSGRPYFVMELVKGMPITRYCDEHKLTPRQRLELFVPVCEAVQHAHSKGVIHRDLKPSNVLAALYDGRPVPKVIDFGVAKAAGPKLTERTLFTEFGAVVGTLEYMSPEQAGLNELDIDTRSDVYSLGVLLYELLTGTTPLGRERLKDPGLVEALRLIREEEPPRPSARLSTTAELPALAANRGLEPKRLRGVVRGELDWIVMKALEKDRGRRYQTASAFAADVGRYLADEPVQACPPSALYRFGKFARRNKAALAGAALLGVTALALLALAGLGVVLGSYQRAEAAFRSEAAARQAEAEADEQKERFHYYHRIALARLALRDDPDLAEQILDQCPARFRGWEWHYLHGLFHADLLTVPAPGGVSGVAFTPDGQLLACGCGDGTVSIREANTGREVRALAGHTGPVCGVALSRDGRRLASAAGTFTGSLPARRGEVKVWDVTTGTVVVSIPVQGLLCVALSPDGRSAAGSFCDGLIRVWDADTGQEEFSLQGDPYNGLAVAFSPDGKLLASGGGTAVLDVWDISTRQHVHLLRGHSGPVTGVVFRPDGKQIASASQDGTVKVWDGGTGQEVLSLGGQPTSFHVAAYSPDGARLASAGAEGTVKLWDVTAGRELATYRGHHGIVWGVAFSPDGARVASAGVDGTVKVWDATRDPDALVLRGHSEIVAGAAFSPGGSRLATAGADGTLKTWDPAGGQELGSIPVSLYTTRTGDPGDLVVAFTPGGVYLAGYAPGNVVNVWEASTGRELHSLAGYTHGPSGAAFGPDGKRLATASIDKTVRVWDVSAGQQLLVLPGLSDPVKCVAFSPDGRRLATGGIDKTVRLWDPETGREFLTFPPQAEQVMVLAFSPDGRRIASADSYGTVYVWDAGSGRLLFSFDDGRKVKGPVISVAFSPDGQRLATGSFQGNLKLWDATNGENVFSFPRQNGAVRTLLFSPDGRRLVSAAGDRTVKVWDAGSGAALEPAAPEAAAP
jgi:WD40 repeat protein/serine/threonine protein kinase